MNFQFVSYVFDRQHVEQILYIFQLYLMNICEKKLEDILYLFYMYPIEVIK